MRMFLPSFAALIGLATPAWSRDGAAQGSSWQPNLLDPSSFLRSLPRQAVISATQYGARPNDGIDDSNAISAALAGAQAHRAAAVLLPAGNYDIGSAVRLVSNVALMGEGCARTRLTRGVSNHSQMLLRLDGGTNVRVQGIAFDHNAGPPFTRSIGLRGAGSHGLVILDNCFNDSRPYTQGGDRWAIALGAETSPSSRIWIGRNRSNGGMQLTAGGDPGITTLRIVDNDVRNGRNAGIAVSHLDPRAVFRDLVIARNRIDNALGLGVFLGPDAPGTRGGIFQDVTIADNIIRGFAGRFPTGIYVRASEVTNSGISITGNQLDGLGKAEATAIRLEDRDHFGGRFNSVLIADNLTSGFERGIWLHAVDGATVRANRVDGSRGLMIDPKVNGRVSVEP